MCIAIYIPKDGTITKDVLKNCFENNPDGAGFAYIEDSEIKIAKGFFNFKRFFKDFRKVRRNVSSPFLLHFRIATHGYVNYWNCHPFLINKNLAFCHNGVIAPEDVIIPKHLSDTICFKDGILRKLPKDFYKNEGILNLIKEYIGWSKLVFMNNIGNVTIVHEDHGEWIDGVWYSNKSYEKRKKITYFYDNKPTTITQNSSITTNVSTVITKDIIDVNKTNTETKKKHRWIQEQLYCETCETYLVFDDELEIGICRNCSRLLVEHGENPEKLSENILDIEEMSDI